VIVVNRLTAAEVDVLVDALIEYQSLTGEQRRRSRNTVTRDDCTWRLHLTAELLDALATK
jgi:hypothetical protein